MTSVLFCSVLSFLFIEGMSYACWTQVEELRRQLLESRKMIEQMNSTFKEHLQQETSKPKAETSLQKTRWGPSDPSVRAIGSG